MATPRGVKKINEKLIQDGRALVITEEEAGQINWASIPDGSIKINPITGIMSVKLAGESDWVPGGVRNDGTICIAKDSKITTESFTIIDDDCGDGMFIYENSDGTRRTKPLTAEGYPSFELEKGTYIPKRNAIDASIDGVLHRSANTESLTELDSHRFALREKVAIGIEVQATYIEKFKIGNPMPRIFVGETKPDVSDYADFWFDTNATIDAAGFTEDALTAVEVLRIPWNHIDGKPTTIAGFGIVDFEHRHNVSDIDGLNAFNGVAPHNHSKANITDFNHTHALTDIDGLGNHTHQTSQITGFNTHRHSVSTLDGLETVISIPAGLITMWYGAVNGIPTGWTLCNGQNGTPDLVDRFIIGAGSSYVVGATGGEAQHILTTGEIPSHTHSINLQQMNSNSDSGWGKLSTGNAGAEGTIPNINSEPAGGGQAHNNMPPYYALCYIMKL